MADIRKIKIDNTTYNIKTDANVQFTDGSGGGGGEDVDLSILWVDNYGADYGFSYDYEAETIKPDNIGVDESYAYGVVELYTEEATTATVYFRQSSEQNYDFGEISELGYYLNMDNLQDESGVLWSGSEYDDYEGSVEYELEAGYNYFTIKYLKDSSSESGDDTFEITRITLGSGGGGGGGTLINIDTQEEIQISQLGDLPETLQDIRDSIPEPIDTTNLMTLNTTQKTSAAKAIFGTDVAFGSDQSQKNLLAVISDNNSTGGTWIGRMSVGAKNKTFILGTYGSICVLGAHSWTNAQQGTGAAWEPVYINPDGDKTVFIGGSPINGKQALMKISNVNANTTGTVKINRSSNLTNNFKDVACWSDNISKFTNDAGYITNSALSGYATETWVGNQGYITGISSSDVTTALGYTPYSSSNPNGYTSNVGTVTSVNNTSPDSNGNVSIAIPTVNDATLTIQKNGTTVNTFTANASSNVTCNITVPTNTNELTNGAGFITGINSSDVTTALGYTPYNSSNPNGYTSNVGTVTSVNNVSPVNGNVSLTIPSITIQDITTLSNGTISLTNACSLYKHTPSGATTYTFSTGNLSLSSSVAYTFELCVVMSTVYGLTFPNTITWLNNETPDLSATGTYFLVFRTIDGGSTWLGNLQGKW